MKLKNWNKAIIKSLFMTILYLNIKIHCINHEKIIFLHFWLCAKDAASEQL